MRSSMDRWSSWAQSLRENSQQGLTSAVSFIKNVAMLNVSGEIQEELSAQICKVTDNIYGPSLGFTTAVSY